MTQDQLIVQIAGCTTIEQLNELYKTIPFRLLDCDDVIDALETQVAMINSVTNDR